MAKFARMFAISTEVTDRTKPCCASEPEPIAQPVFLDLAEFDGFEPVEMLGMFRFQESQTSPTHSHWHPTLFYGWNCSRLQPDKAICLTLRSLQRRRRSRQQRVRT